MLCPERANTKESFTDVTVPLSPSAQPTPILMNAGDVLFFNGSLIHGSFPNRSETRFRRSLIGHYIVGEAKKVGGYYHPVLRMDGSEVELGESDGAGPCGIWREIDGSHSVELVQPDEPAAAMHE